MNFKAVIDILPREELLDPQGKTIANNLHNVDIHGVQEVRIGKHIIMKLSAESQTDVNEKVENACKKLLANPIMETYSYSIEPA